MHTGIIEHRTFHFAAVHASISREIDQDRFPLLGCHAHPLFIVVIFSETAAIKVEILGKQRRHESADALKRRTPQTGYEINGESKRHHCKEEPSGADTAVGRAVVLEIEGAEQIETHKAENHNPQSQERLTVEDMPAICQVGHRQEFKRQGQFYETEHNLDGVHP